MTRSVNQRKNELRARGITGREGEGASNGTSDPLVFRCEDIRRILLPIVEHQDALRQDWRETHARFAPGQPVGGLGYLANEFGVDQRRVRAIFNCEQKWVGVGTIDKWFSRAGLSHLFAKLRPVANPAWSLERWMGWANLNGGCEYVWGWNSTEAGVENFEL